MSNLSIKFKVVTPERNLFEGEVEQVTLPTTMGQITILPNHRSYIASLVPGEIVVKNGEEEIDIYLSGGFIEFANNKLVVLADEAERAEEIDLEKAEEAKKRAEELKDKQIEMDENEYARVMAAIQKESARIRVARKHYTKRGMSMNNNS